MSLFIKFEYTNILKHTKLIDRNKNMNIDTLFKSTLRIGRDGKRYGKSELHFDKIDEFIKQNENIEQFLDQLYEIANLTYSNESKMLFELISQHIKSNYYVDILVKMSVDENSSYLKHYSCNSLTKVNSDYAICKAIENDIFNEYILDLYLNNMERDDVFNYCLIKVKTDCGFYNDRMRVLLKMKECLENENKLVSICEAFKYILAHSTNYQSAYPAKNDCGTILKITKNYIHHQSVIEIFDIALHSVNVEFKSLGKELLESNEKYEKLKLEVDTKIHLKLLQSAFDKFEWYQTLCIYQLHERTFLEFNFADMLISQILENFKNEYDLERVKYPQSGGYTPLGLTDTTWQPYYKIILVIGLIGKYTKNKMQFNLIRNTLKSLIIYDEDDTCAIQSVLFDLKQNLKFGNDIIEKCYDNNKLYFRHTMHSNENTYNQYVRNKIDITIEMYKADKNEEVKKVYAYMLNKYVNTSYNWMKPLYNHRKDETQKIVQTEICL